MTRHDWERRLDERLKALPDRRAPASLLAKVMAEAGAREAARAGLFGRVPGWAGALGLAAAACAALYLLGLEAAWLRDAAGAAIGPWLTAALSAARGLGSAGGELGAVLSRWRLLFAAAGAVSLTACAGGTVALGVLIGGPETAWRTR